MQFSYTIALVESPERIYMNKQNSDDNLTFFKINEKDKVLLKREEFQKETRNLVACCTHTPLEIRVSQNLAKLGRGGGGGAWRPIKCQGWKGERIGVNCVANIIGILWIEV